MFFPLGIWQGWSDRSNLEEGEEEKKASLKENKEVEYRKKNKQTKRNKGRKMGKDREEQGQRQRIAF